MNSADMPIPHLLLVLLFAFALSAMGTGWMRRLALRRNILDVPNERSSHSVPTPRGGGVAFVVAILVGCLVLWLLDVLSGRFLAALAGGGVLTAGIGWIEDTHGLPPPVRLLAHAAAAGWALAWLGVPARADLGFAVFEWSLYGWAFFLPALVWLINSYNFMDGIDGLAGGEAATVCVAGVLVLDSGGGEAAMLVTAAAVCGFLLWNWSPARVFMGDAGSGFLGYCMGVFWLVLADGEAGLVGLPILLAAFLVDATLTLFRRISRGEKWRQAHRSHAYQIAARRWGHARTAKTILRIDLFWLVPCALLTTFRPDWSWFTLPLAFLPLAGLWAALQGMDSRHFPVDGAGEKP